MCSDWTSPGSDRIDGRGARRRRAGARTRRCRHRRGSRFYRGHRQGAAPPRHQGHDHHAQGAARESYLQNFANEPEEKTHPGFFSENLYAASSLIFDSAGVAAQAFAADYIAKAGTSPSWAGGGAYDAARLMIDALKRAAVQNRSDSKVQIATVCASRWPRSTVRNRR